ncbi:MAG TPA: ABC transporter permease [Lachnospiraceae bacterium]|nr:ABC transporter permease [Lachnospiraceae bacterium]
MKNYIACEYLKIRKWHLELLIIVMTILSIGLAHSITEKIIDAGTVRGTEGELTYAFATNIFFAFGLPLMTIIFLVMYVNIENTNGGWKLLRITGGDIRIMTVAKLLVSYIYLVASYIFFLLVFWGFNLVWNLNINYKSMMEQLGYSMIGSFINITFLFVLFHFIRSVVINSLLGIVGLVINNVIVQTKYWKYFFTTYYYYINITDGSLKLIIMLVSILGSLMLFCVAICLAKKIGKDTENE